MLDVIGLPENRPNNNRSVQRFQRSNCCRAMDLFMATDCQAVAADSTQHWVREKSEKTKSYLCYLGECVVRRHTSTARDSPHLFPQRTSVRVTRERGSDPLGSCRVGLLNIVGWKTASTKTFTHTKCLLIRRELPLVSGGTTLLFPPRPLSSGRKTSVSRASVMKK